jgi:hypothetical protein
MTKIRFLYDRLKIGCLPYTPQYDTKLMSTSIQLPWMGCNLASYMMANKSANVVIWWMPGRNHRGEHV